MDEQPQSPSQSGSSTNALVESGGGQAVWNFRTHAKSIIACLTLLVAYVILFRMIVTQDEYRAFVSRVLLSPSPWRNYIAFMLILNIALLAPGSATLIILAALPIFGPTTTFLLSLGGGMSATLLAHRMGRWFRALETREKRWQRIRQVENILSRYKHRIWLLSFASRAIPNPLYDVWPFAFGFFLVPLRTYLAPATLGGATMLLLLCFLPWLLSR